MRRPVLRIRGVRIRGTRIRETSVRGAGIRAAGAILAGALAVTACGSGASSGTPKASGAAGATAVSLATSLATAAESWAVVPMSSDPAFWEVFARPTNSASWRLVTPPGVADNGGIVASAGAPSSLTVAVRPSQDLLFSPLAATANGGGSWSTGGPIDAAVAASPDALAASAGKLITLLSDGTIETSSDAGATWSTVARPGAIAASPAGKRCSGAVRVTSVSFGMMSSQVLAGGTCGTSGATALFSYTAGSGWQRVSLPVSGQLVRLTAGTALVLGKAGLTALSYGFGWYAYAPLAPSGQARPTVLTASAALPVSGPVTASGTLPLGGAWVLLPGGRAATIGGPGQQWLLLPPVPATTTVLASGPHGAVDALGVSGTTLTVWRLAPKATVWSKVQTISVPIQYGSSS
jgi:hypothetical protein